MLEAVLLWTLVVIVGLFTLGMFVATVFYGRYVLSKLLRNSDPHQPADVDD